ncbi:vegetative protein [Pyxidicoccus sp. 3LG]
MDLANALGEMFRRELQAQLAPLQAAVRRMDEGLEALELLRDATYRLAPLTSRLGAMAGVRTPEALQELVVVRAPARGQKLDGAARGRAAVAKGPGRRASADSEARACAVKGCKRPSRSKGYCSAHYQKLRLLMRTNRRPAEWVDDAKPQSVQEVMLPRGRAGSKALKEAAKAARTARTAASPKTRANKAKAKAAPNAKARAKKAPARKKGKNARASLH